jgi:hypothetical protein
MPRENDMVVDRDAYDFAGFHDLPGNRNILLRWLRTPGRVVVRNNYWGTSCNDRSSKNLTWVDEAAVEYSFRDDLEAHHTVRGAKPEDEKSFMHLISEETGVVCYKILGRADHRLFLTCQFGKFLG